MLISAADVQLINDISKISGDIASISFILHSITFSIRRFFIFIDSLFLSPRRRIDACTGDTELNGSFEEFSIISLVYDIAWPAKMPQLS
jgi:hypothetical protein